MSATAAVLLALAVAVILLLIVGAFRWRSFSEFERVELARFEVRREIGDIERQAMQQMTNVGGGRPSPRAYSTDIIEGTALEVDRRCD